MHYPLWALENWYLFIMYPILGYIGFCDATDIGYCVDKRKIKYQRREILKTQNDTINY